MKTIRQHWESLPNRKLGEWLMKQPKDARIEKITDEFDALRTLNWNISDAIKACYKLRSWQPLLDTLPELREVNVVPSTTPRDIEGGTDVKFEHPNVSASQLDQFTPPKTVQPQPTDSTRIEQLETEIRKLRTEAAIKEGKEINQRRSEILQLVAAMTMNKSLVWTPKDITDAVKQAILLQSEIDQQLSQR